MMAARFAFAGLFEHWSKGGQTVDSCTLITPEPNHLVWPVHDRMPVILPPERYEEWLDPENKDVEGLLRLLGPYEARKMTACPVSEAENRAGVDSPECVRSVGEVELQPVNVQGCIGVADRSSPGLPL